VANAIVIGSGIFGVTAALELRARGRDVVLVDPGPVPHPLAESTDISKIVRLDYGSDEHYTAMMEEALEGWRRWNRDWGSPLFHETGVMFATRRPMAAGGFEHDSYEVLMRRGHRLERLDAAALHRRYPAWSSPAASRPPFVDGYYNPEGGWAESGAVVARLVAAAADAGVRLRPQFPVARLAESGSRITGVFGRDGERLDGDEVIVAVGSWTPHLLPWLAPHLRSVGQPVFHLVPADPTAFEAKTFPVFGADIARTGYYGFPIQGGVVKIANHGTGREMHPESEARVVGADDERAIRAFLRDTFPSLADATIKSTRVCVYGDTWDQHFWIAPDPDRAGLVVATGGSGHGFKFAPVLGALIADAADGKVVPRFRWRTDAAGAAGQEQARHRGD
jgi:glycine/D-amino acid oxidase-like deaminating enzyme